jgi:DNA modification methylase
VLRQLEGHSVDCVVTSPPYYRQRIYNGSHSATTEIGQETTQEEYVANLVAVGIELFRIVKSKGSFWLNIGDKCQGKRWLGIPWRTVFALEKLGWQLRNEVIWHKPKHLPNAAKDRLAYAHEQFFHFVKSENAYYDMDQIREPPKPPITDRNGVVKTPTGVSGARYREQILSSKALSEDEKKAALAALDEAVEKVKCGVLPDFRMLIRGIQRPTHGDATALSGRAMELESKGFAILTYHRNGSAPTDVWTIQVEDSVFPESHFAVFPESLVERPIRATSPPNGIVLDPFLGSGTTAVVALRLGRRTIGIDTSSEYLEFAKQRIAKVLRDTATLEMFA